MSFLFTVFISCQGADHLASRSARVEMDKAGAVPIALLSDIGIGDLLISEIMHDPAQVSDWRGEWIEVYNPSTSTALELNGLLLTSTTEAGFTITSSVVVEPEGYALLAPNSVPSLNGGIEPDYRYSYDDFKLTSTEDISISYQGTVFDTIGYQGGAGNLFTGYSLSLMPQYLDAQGNDDQDNWCPAASSFGMGDFGTPGSENDACYHASELVYGDIIFTEIMPDPFAVVDWRGEWFEVYNTTGATIDLRGLELGSLRDSGDVITEQIYMRPEQYFLFGVNASANNGGLAPDFVYSYGLLKQYGTDTLSLGVAGTEIDSVSWIIDDWEQTGYALGLSPVAFDANENDDIDLWCPASSTYGQGDYGTPGAPNASCMMIDYDLDGYSEADGDCDDTNSALNPGMTEVCDGIDNDCDTLIDDDDPSNEYTADQVWYLDVDGDGAGGLWIDAVYACEQPIDGYGGYYSNTADDCDDLEALSYPGGPEILDDGIDGNCDGWDNDCAFGTCDWGVYLSNYAIIDMNLIPAGDDPLGRYSLSSDFYLMTTEVTQGHYERLMGQVWKNGRSGFYGLGSRYPVYHVSWHMAADYANALTRYYNSAYETSWAECYSCTDEGTIDASCVASMEPYDCDGFRLPTEAEWEYAGRSGTVADVWTGEGEELGGYITSTWDCATPSVVVDGASNPLLSDYSWYCLTGNNKTVAQKLPNGFGLYDMHGNEWEWMADWDSCTYPNRTEDPFCDVTGTDKVRKGGDWNDYAFNQKLYPRYSKPPTDRYAVIGFRLARSAR